MMRFSTGDLVEISKVPGSVLHTWIRAGLLGNDLAGEMGSGHPREFNIAQVLAVTVGARYRKEQASGDRVAGVIRFLAGCTIEHIEAELKAGRTMPVPASLLTDESGLPWVLRNGILVEPPKDVPPGVAKLLRKLDLKTIYEDVQKWIAKIASRPTTTNRGRKRQLVGASR